MDVNKAKMKNRAQSSKRVTTGMLWSMGRTIVKSLAYNLWLVDLV